MSRDEFIKMRGAWDTRHWIQVPALKQDTDVIRVEAALKKLSGVSVIKFYPEKRKVRITYDQTKIDFRNILRQLEEAGFPASAGWWSRLKADWFQYLDQNARENANAPEPPCCSNPRGIGGGREIKK